MNQRELFFKHLGQTSPAPLGLEIVRAEGVYLYDVSGKKYLDAIGGISVCNTGHRHPDVVKAIRDQTDRYLHVLVYGELIQSPQVEYAHLLAVTSSRESTICLFYQFRHRSHGRRHETGQKSYGQNRNRGI